MPIFMGLPGILKRDAAVWQNRTLLCSISDHVEQLALLLQDKRKFRYVTPNRIWDHITMTATVYISSSKKNQEEPIINGIFSKTGGRISPRRPSAVIPVGPE